jgi:hypothetical protein
MTVMHTSARACGLALLAPFLALACRAHPGQLAISLVEGYVDAHDIQERGPQLVGQPAATANAMLAPRVDTLDDLRTGHSLLVFLEPGRTVGETYFLVEVDRDDTIRNLLKVRFNIEGVTDLHENKEVRSAILGKRRPDAEAAGHLGAALRVLRSRENGHTIGLYKSRGLVPHTYVDYCAVWYDRRTGVCIDNAMLGVIAAFTTDRLEAPTGSSSQPAATQPSAREGTATEPAEKDGS